MPKPARRKQIDIVQLKLRIREELRRKLEREAAKKGHSLNTEMVERLEASFAVESQVRDQKELLTAVSAETDRAVLEVNNIWIRQFVEQQEESPTMKQLRELMQRLVKEGKL